MNIEINQERLEELSIADLHSLIDHFDLQMYELESAGGEIIINECLILLNCKKACIGELNRKIGNIFIY